MKGVVTRLSVLLLIAFLIPAVVVHGQSAEEQRSIFIEAESHYLYGEYELANPLYLILNDLIPGNANIKFKIGDCYLNIPDERSKAVAFLEEAARHADALSKTDQLKETRAPLEAWFLLGTAYRINNELDKAINTYQRYLRLAGEAGADINTEFVTQQITACNNAILQMQNPVHVTTENLGPVINQGAVSFNPVISYDGNSMVYSENRGLENAIFYTIKERGQWQPPIEITRHLGNAFDCHATSLNADGTELYLYKSDNFDGNIYVSTLENGLWTKMKKLNKNINTRYYESHASISADGTKLYFSSNRPGGYGELDIYVSERGAGDNWRQAVNLGATVNTAFNDNAPFVTADGLLLFFSSEGHSSMGGYDIYKNSRRGDEWGKPDNLGYPINTTDDDIFFQPHDLGSSGYYSLYTGYKNREIMKVVFGLSAGNFTISGTYSFSDSAGHFTADNSIFLLNLVNGDTLGVTIPKDTTGIYSFEATTGIYRLIYTGRGYITEYRDTILTAADKASSIVIDVLLHPDPEYVSGKPDQPEATYEKIDMSKIPAVETIDSSILHVGMVVKDINDTAIEDDKVLYYTVQVMALLNPVDVSYFKYISDMVVIYNDTDKFYRYTTGRFNTRAEAYAYRLQLISKGYPNEIFVKKVFRE